MSGQGLGSGFRLYRVSGLGSRWVWVWGLCSGVMLLYLNLDLRRGTLSAGVGPSFLASPSLNLSYVWFLGVE